MTDNEVLISDNDSVYGDSETIEAAADENDIAGGEENAEDIEREENSEDLENIEIDDIHSEQQSEYICYLSADAEAALFEIRDNTNLLVYGVIPLAFACVISYLFYRWVSKTFFIRG